MRRSSSKRRSTPQLRLGRRDALPVHERLDTPHRLGQLGKNGRVVAETPRHPANPASPFPEPGVAAWLRYAGISTSPQGDRGGPGGEAAAFSPSACAPSPGHPANPGCRPGPRHPACRCGAPVTPLADSKSTCLQARPAHDVHRSSTAQLGLRPPATPEAKTPAPVRQGAPVLASGFWMIW